MGDGVRFSGPLFDGRAQDAAHRGTQAIQARLAARGATLAASMVFATEHSHRTGASVRGVTTTEHSTVYETGHYVMPVVVDLGETVVTTDLATYGPWLEGTGSRNLTTRFKGYHAFRLAGQALDAEAEVIADEELALYVREMN